MDTDTTIDYHAVARNAAAVLAAAHRRLRAGSWTPTRAEQVMAANILAAARPDPGAAEAFGAPGHVHLARWAPLIRLAHSIDPAAGADRVDGSTATLSSVLAAAYPLARHVETRLPRSTASEPTASGPAASVVADLAALLEKTGSDSIPDLLTRLAAPLTRTDPGTPGPPPTPAPSTPER